MNPTDGYYGPTIGELVILTGGDGTVGVQLEQTNLQRIACRCEWCGDKFSITAGQRKQGRVGRFCSMEHYSEARARVVLKCAYCGGKRKRYTAKYCSYRCSGMGRKK